MVMMANYESLATELLQVNEDLAHMPTRHLLTRLSQGEPFVLNYLLHHRQAHPVDLQPPAWGSAPPASPPSWAGWRPRASSSGGATR